MRRATVDGTFKPVTGIKVESHDSAVTTSPNLSRGISQDYQTRLRSLVLDPNLRDFPDKRRND